MFNRVLIALLTVLAVAGFGTVSEPAAAKTCEAVLAKGRGLDEAAASARSLKHLKNRINHWAAKNKLGSVGVGHRSTVCSKKGAYICTSSAKVCG